MRRGLVLGGGGLVGMAYHAGALKALDDFGVNVSDSDVIVGTSAGAILGSYLATGWSQSDFYEYAYGRHPKASRDPADPQEAVRALFEPLWGSGADRLRRSVGSLFSVVSARGYWKAGGRGKVPGAQLRRAFPSGLYSTERTRARFKEDLPESWPRKDVFICTADLYSGERVAFGYPGAPDASLPDAVLAATAIPGVFPPVRIGDRYYVDGGVVTATSLDLAAEAGCDRIICIAPLGYRNEKTIPFVEPKMWAPMLVRLLFARTLAREVKEARARGVQVLVIRPWLEELRAHGTNSMRHHDRTAVVEGAREGALRLLERNADHPALEIVAKEPA